MTIDIKLELDCRSLNGESPRWSVAERKLYWVDTREPALHAFDPITKRDIAWEMPSWVGCQVLTRTGALVALRTGLYEFQHENASLHQLGQVPYDVRRFIFNDGGCDPAGRFLVGEMYLPLKPGDEKEHAPDSAPLFRYSPNGTWVDMAASTKTSNGLAWSPDGKVMYQSDTASKTIFAFDYDVEHGQCSHRRVFAQVETRDKNHGPDGAAVDRDGFYLCAVFGEGCLLRFDPEGTLERRIEMPVQYPTMPAYGGADLSTVFVTTAKWMIDPGEWKSRPLEGGLFSLEMPVPGLEWVLKTHAAFDPDDGSLSLHDNLRVNRAFHGWGHQFLYSAVTLCRMLEVVGYVGVEFFDYGRSNDRALCDLELHGDYSVDFGYPSVWIVEAGKPAAEMAVDETFHAFVEGFFTQYLRGGH